MRDKEILNQIHDINIHLLKNLDHICRKYNVVYYLSFGTLLGAVRHKGMIPWDNDIDVWMTRDQFAKFYEHCDEISHDIEVVLPDCHGDKKYFDCNVRLEYKNARVNFDDDINRYYNYHGFGCIHLDIFYLDKTVIGIREKIQRMELILLYSMMNGYRHPKVLYHYSLLLDFVQSVLRVIGRRISLSWLRSRVEKVAMRFDDSPNATHYFGSTSTESLLVHRLFPKRVFEYPVDADFENLRVYIPNGAKDVLQILYGDYMKLPPEEERVPHIGYELLKLEMFSFEKILEKDKVFENSIAME